MQGPAKLQGGIRPLGRPGRYANGSFKASNHHCRSWDNHPGCFESFERTPVKVAEEKQSCAMPFMRDAVAVGEEMYVLPLYSVTVFFLVFLISLSRAIMIGSSPRTNLSNERCFLLANYRVLLTDRPFLFHDLSNILPSLQLLKTE